MFKLKISRLLILAAVISNTALAQPFWPEVLIIDQDKRDDDPLDEDGVIDGIDYYNVHEYEGYDFGPVKKRQKPQKQEEYDPVENMLEGTPHWEMYRNDFDSYQEVQTHRMLEFQKERGNIPRD